MNTEQLKLERIKYGIPEEGLGKKDTQGISDRLSTFDASFGESSITEEEKKPGLGEQFATGLAKGEVDFVRGLGKFGQKILQQTVGRVVEKITGKPKEELGSKFFEGEKPEFLKPKTGMEKAGAFSFDIASYLVPETFIAKSFVKAPAIIRGGIQVAKDIGITGLQKGKIDKEAITTGIISTGARGFVPIVKLLSNVFRRTLGFIAQRGTDLVDEVVRSPEYAKLGLRGDPVKILKDSATELSNLTSNVKKTATQTFKKGVELIEKNYEELLSGFKIIKPKTIGELNTIKLRDGTSIIKDIQGNKFNISLESLKGVFSKIMHKFKATGNTKTGFNFNNTTFNNTETTVLNKALNKLNEWTDITPSGFNHLADAIKGFAKPEIESMKRANAAIFNLASSIDDYLIKRVPKFKEMNMAFSKSQKFLEELSVYLNAFGRTDSPREIQRISSKIQNLFGANKESARAFLRSVPGGEKILGMEAGRELVVSDITKASGAIGNFVANAIQTLVPPKAIGEIAVKLGVTEKIAQKIYITLKPLNNATKVIIINLIKEMTE